MRDVLSFEVTQEWDSVVGVPSPREQQSRGSPPPNDEKERHAVDLDEYFGQGELYFSESQGQLIRIDEMVPQYALNCYNKLTRQFGPDFQESALAEALLGHVTQASDALSDVLTRHGKATVFVGAGGPSVAAARKRLRRAGATQTHKRDDWVEGTMAPVQVNVRRRKERANA